MTPHELDMRLESGKWRIGGRLGRWLCARGWHSLVSAYPLRGKRCVRKGCSHFTEYP